MVSRISKKQLKGIKGKVPFDWMKNEQVMPKNLDSIILEA